MDLSILNKLWNVKKERPNVFGRRYIDGLISTGNKSLYNIKNIFHENKILY
jgi:hypothetical protein